ncbi:MAG: M23 family metallopeptidase [Alistipes putredinis]|nr:MAG: M23 family metallopeptidase [Alistipes putredinis]
MVTFKGWSGGGGNTLKIKHPRNLMSGYLHLRGYAKGIGVGTHVRQGQLIGYVGSTGASTGPHLDFRLWKGGKPIDPLKAPSEPTEPISAENMTAFSFRQAEHNGRIGRPCRLDAPNRAVSTRFPQPYGRSTLRKIPENNFQQNRGFVEGAFPCCNKTHVHATMPTIPEIRRAAFGRISRHFSLLQETCSVPLYQAAGTHGKIPAKAIAKIRLSKTITVFFISTGQPYSAAVSAAHAPSHA